MSILLKSFAFFLLFGLLNCTCTSSANDATVTENYLYYYDSSASASSCLQRQFSNEEVQYGAYKCCYEAADCSVTNNDGDRVTVELKVCAAATKAEYERIDQMVEEGRTQCSNLKIDCSSSSLSYFYLVYLLLLFLF